jgi:hypothetical protein
MKKSFPVIFLILSSLIILISFVPICSAELPEKLSTVAGVLAIEKGKSPPSTDTITLNGKPIFEDGAGYLTFIKQSKIKNTDVILFSYNPGGSGTWDEYRLMILRPNGQYLVSKRYDVEWTKPELNIEESGDKIIMRLTLISTENKLTYDKKEKR